jgi:hypothetical protein
MHNLAGKQQERVKEMAATWARLDEEYRRHGTSSNP